MFQPNDDIKIRITSRHENLSDALRDDIEDKVHRAEKFLSGGFRQAHVILTYEKKVHECEVNLSGGDEKFSAQGISHDMYTSIEACFAKLMRQAGKAKDKRVSRNSRMPRSLGSIRHGLIAAPEEGEEVEVVRSKKYPVKSMSVDEAARKLADSKDDLLVFRNDESGKTNVMYKRHDQQIGLIEPEH